MLFQGLLSIFRGIRYLRHSSRILRQKMARNGAKRLCHGAKYSWHMLSGASAIVLSHQKHLMYISCHSAGDFAA